MTESKIVLPKAILFDWDNTLVDSLMLVHQALNHALVTYDLEPWTYEETIVRSHKSYLEYFPALFADQWKDAVEVYRAHYVKLRVNMKPFYLAEDVLILLKKHKIYTALVSNKLGYILREEVNTLGWDHYFGKVIGSGDLDSDKPAPVTVESALEGVSIVNRNHIWFVGDSVTDMETAFNSNCVPVFFGTDDYNSERFVHCRPRIAFAGHKELLQYLEDLLKGADGV